MKRTVYHHGARFLVLTWAEYDHALEVWEEVYKEKHPNHTFGKYLHNHFLDLSEEFPELRDAKNKDACLYVVRFSTIDKVNEVLDTIDPSWGEF